MPTVYFSTEKRGFMPQEELLMKGTAGKSLLIGIPKEADEYEHRIVLTPESVGLLTQKGHQVMIESRAGADSNYSDLQYGETGAFIVSRREVYLADVLLKINPPLPEEIDLMKERQILFSFLPPFLMNGECMRRLMDKRSTALSFDNIKDRYGSYPLVKMMSEIAGNVAIQVAAGYMNKSSGGKGILLGGVSGVNPAEVVIIGAGTAAEFAARSALGLGAFVRIFDNSVHRLQRLQNNMAHRLYTSVMYPLVLGKALASADVLIGAIFPDETQSDFPVTEEMVATMKQGAVIIDLSINRGGCCETSELRNLKSPITLRHGVVHYCVPNIASLVPRTASMAISNIMTGLLLDMEMHGSMANWIKGNAGVRNGVYMFNGILTNAGIGDLLDIPSRDIHLLMAAF
ncbi:MAG: alanine dehydrogenase [Bacteroidales bacterium]|jgi:alanine dehydrogenase|nr:alanine dehydrogenase [Bacteroidales bacterium]